MQPPREHLSAEIVKACLHYDQGTGVLYWRSSPRPGWMGRVAGYRRLDGYITVTINRHVCLAHRLAFICMRGYWPQSGIDHINGDPSDNRWINLREADSDQNHWNMKVFRNNTSGYRGVTYHRKTGKWVAEIWHKRKKYYLGIFSSKEDASSAYESARAKMFGLFNREQNLNI